MQPTTEGQEEQGPSRIPFVNDPAKTSSARHAEESVEEMDEEEEEEEEEEED